MEIKILNKIIDTIRSINSYHGVIEFLNLEVLYRDDTIRKGLIDIKLSNNSIDAKSAEIKSLVCSHRLFKDEKQVTDNLFVYSLFPVQLFLTSCIKEYFIYFNLNDKTNIPEEIEALCTLKEYQKIKDEALGLAVPSYNSFVDEFWSNCSNTNDIGSIVAFYRNRLADVIYDSHLSMNSISIMNEKLSMILEMGLISDSIFNLLNETYKIMVDEQFDYFDKINYFIEDAEYSMNPEANPNYMEIRRTPKDDTTDIENQQGREEYIFDNALLLKVYNFCIENKTFIDVNFVDFIRNVNNAEFKSLFDLRGTVKSKLKYTISFLSKKTNREWYQKSARSIGLSPSDCSGANVSEDWKKQLNVIK